MALDFSSTIARYVGHRVQVRMGTYATIFGTLVQVNSEILRLGNSRIVSEYDESDWFSKISESDPEMTEARSDGETVVRMHYVASVTCLSDELDTAGKVERSSARDRLDHDWREDHGRSDDDGLNDEYGAYGASSCSHARSPLGALNESEQKSSYSHSSLNASLDEKGVPAVCEIRVELGLRLIHLADPLRGGDLLKRVTMLRKELNEEIGFPVPAIRFRDSVQLPENEYRILFGGTEYGRFELRPDERLIILYDKTNGGDSTVLEPSFGLPARWSTEPEIECAKHGTCVTSSSVLTTHLSELCKEHASELITFDCVASMVDQLRNEYPVLIDELIPTYVNIRMIYQVLVRMLREGVSIRNLRRIIEALGEVSTRRLNDDDIYRYTRRILGRIVCAPFIHDNQTMQVVVLEPSFEKEITQSIRNAKDSRKLVAAYGNIFQAAFTGGGDLLPLMIGGSDIREEVWSVLNNSLVRIPVIASSEVPRGIQVITTEVVAGCKNENAKLDEEDFEPEDDEGDELRFGSLDEPPW